MAYKDNRDEVKKEEFELVNNSEKSNVFKIEVDHYEMTKDGFVMYGKDNKKIGIVDANNKITIFPEYEEEIKSREGISLDSRKIIIQDAESLKDKEREYKQQEKNTDEQRQQVYNLEEILQREERERNERSSSTRITHQDLINNPKFKDVTSWTRIDDQKFTDAMNPSTKNGTLIDKNSVIVAEVGGDFKILAKSLGTNEIIDLTADARVKDTMKAQVNRIEGNVEDDIGRQCTIQIPMIENKEIIINKTPTGKINLQQIDTSSGNDDKALPIGTDNTMHPTEEELNRAKQEQDGIYTRNSIMTLEEVEKEVDPMILEYAKKMKDADEMNSIKDEVMEYARTSNPTRESLEEIVKNRVEEFEKSEEDDQLESEKEHEEKEEHEDEEWLYGMSSRRRPRI